MSEPFETKFITTTASGSKIKSPITLHYIGGRIEFLKSPFSLKDEIKSMQGSRWHGFDDNPRKIWSVADCERNNFQIRWLMGENSYEWWDRPLEEYEFERPLYAHQELMANHMLTYHYCIIAAEMGSGKTLASIECIEQSGHKDWYWAGPKSAIAAVEREFTKWGLSSDINLELMTYNRLTSMMKAWKDDIPRPGVIFDESSRLKTAATQRTVAAQNLADLIREHHGKEGYVILMSGTPAAKHPVEWWSQANIAWPGFLREGSVQACEKRLAIFTEKETLQGKHLQRVTWLDDKNKCKHCGGYADEEQHDLEFADDSHNYEFSINEVAYLYKRLKGLAVVLYLKDCVDLPDKQYRMIKLEPSATISRVAKALVKVAPNVISGMTWLRELSDGFQYRDVEDGVVECPVCEDGTGEVWVDPEDPDKSFEMIDMLDSEYVATLEKTTIVCTRCEGSQQVPNIVRITKEIPCPKDAAVKQLLEENDEQGRLVFFAGFTGSINRIVNLCVREHWAVIRVDGRGWRVFDIDGNPAHQVKPLDYWADMDNPRVAFVAHPQSGGMGITLTEARMAVFYSNDFSAESRRQSEDRIHRIGMDNNLGATIVDIVHLPTDEKVIDILKSNRKLEKMSMGEIETIFGEE